MMPFYTTCKGKCSLWCQQFWAINEDGTIGGPSYPRKPTTEEIAKCLQDVADARVFLRNQLEELNAIEKILTRKGQS